MIVNLFKNVLVAFEHKHFFCKWHSFRSIVLTLYIYWWNITDWYNTDDSRTKERQIFKNSFLEVKIKSGVIYHMNQHTVNVISKT